MSSGARFRASAKRLGDKDGGPVHLVVVTAGALNATTLVASRTAVANRVEGVTTERRMIRDSASGTIIQSDRRTHAIPALNLPAGVDLSVNTAGRTHRILAPADNAAVAAASTDAQRAVLGREVLSIDPIVISGVLTQVVVETAL